MPKTRRFPSGFEIPQSGIMEFNVKRAFHNLDLSARRSGHMGVNVKRAFHNLDLSARRSGHMGVNAKKSISQS